MMESCMTCIMHHFLSFSRTGVRTQSYFASKTVHVFPSFRTHCVALFVALLLLQGKRIEQHFWHRVTQSISL